MTEQSVKKLNKEQKKRTGYNDIFSINFKQIYVKKKFQR